MPRKEIPTQTPPPKVIPTHRQVQTTEAATAGGYDLADAAARRKMIAEAAYYRAQRRGFQPGHEVEDWLAAENEIVKLWLERTPAADDQHKPSTE